jgi:hypothetical protein
VTQATWFNLFSYFLVIMYLTGCSTQATYMRGWKLEPAHLHRWSGGKLKAEKLSDDEKTVFTELGTPDTIRFFRTAQTRQPVYEWLYQQPIRIVWFVDGQRVDYVAVDANLSSLKKETRETGRAKLIKGGIVGGIVGGVAAGTMVFGKTLGLKD